MKKQADSIRINLLIVLFLKFYVVYDHSKKLNTAISTL